MRGAIASAVLAFVAVLVIAAALRPPGPPEASPTPTILGPAIRCVGIEDPDCQKVASDAIARALAGNPGRTVARVTVRGFSEVEVCFTDGSCYAEARGGPEAQPGAVMEKSLSLPAVP